MSGGLQLFGWFEAFPTVFLNATEIKGYNLKIVWANFSSPLKPPTDGWWFCQY